MGQGGSPCGSRTLGIKCKPTGSAQENLKRKQVHKFDAYFSEKKKSNITSLKMDKYQIVSSLALANIGFTMLQSQIPPSVVQRSFLIK